MRLFFLAVSYLLVSVAPASWADDLAGSIKKGDYEFFYSAFNTSFISPDVARAVGVVRASNRGLVNISIVSYASGERLPVPAQSISGDAYDLIYRHALEFQPVKEPGALYYLAPFKISNDNEFIQFTINVLAEGMDEPVTIKFKRHFYID